MDNSINLMKSLDLFINSLCLEEYEKIKIFLNNEDKNQINLLSFDFHIQYFDKILNKKHNEITLRCKEK